MALDPTAAGLLQQMAEADMPALNEMAPAEAREAAAGFIALAGPGDATVQIEDRTIAGPGGALPVRVYSPQNASGTLGALVYFHGGGWVIGTIESTDAICRNVAARAGCKVVSVEYRLAPEHRYPAPLEDCYAALEWVAANGAELGVDPTRLAVGGDSAGGNLAAAVALKARDEHGPALRLQLLVYPVTDRSYGTASYAANGDGYLLTTSMMEWFWDHYVDADSADDPYVSPLRAKDLSGLPAAVVFTAEFDPLRDEGEAYAAALRAAGVSVEAERFDGQIHAFWQMPATFAAADTAADRAAAALRKAFA